MRIIAYYLIALLLILGLFLFSIAALGLPVWLERYELLLICLAIGGIGGCVYLIRSIYIHVCALKDWDDSWQTWYYLRPIISIICGGVSYVFLKAGLLFLNASIKGDSHDFGFIALAFIAGFNVDNFLEWLETKSQSVLGIKISKINRNKSDETKEN